MKEIIYAFMFVFLFSFVNAMICHQETANASNAIDGSCKLNYTGIYDFNGFTQLDERRYVTDGNYETGASGTEMFINYTKPIGAIAATWNISSKNFLADNSERLLLSSSCWNAYPDKIVLKTHMDYYDDEGDFGTSHVSLYCMNSTGFELLRYKTMDLLFVIREESIEWNIPYTLTFRYKSNNYTIAESDTLHFRLENNNFVAETEKKLTFRQLISDMLRMLFT